MNLLVIIPPKFAGCGFYRLYQPYNHMAKNYDCKVTFASGLMITEIRAFTDKELQEFDAIIWHKTYFEMPDIKRTNSLGIPTIADFDDHWIVNREHSLYKEYMKEGISARLHKLMITAKYVTCSTERLADAIFPHNDNVEVLPNAIDTGYDGLKVERAKEKNFVFGYLGGPCHIRDLGLLKGLPEEMQKNCKNYEFRLFGFNGTDIYKHYARILSGGRNSEFFSLYKGADIFHYPQFYNHMDCSLIPLESNYFNSMKSELKLIEAGHFKKSCIVSDAMPYTNISRHKKNCLVSYVPGDWYKNAKSLLENRTMAADLGEQLHEDTRKFDIAAINKKRFKFLEQCTTKQAYLQPVMT
jgi:hypothetical protein